MNVADILSAASGGEYFEGSNVPMTGSFMAFEAKNGDAVVKVNYSSNVRGIEGKEITILQGGVFWVRTNDVILVSGAVQAFDAI